MNEYSSLRKQNKRSTYAAVIAMILCVVLTTTMLVSRLAAFTAPDTQHYIPLTKSTGTTRVHVGQRQADGSVTYDSLRNMLPNGTLLTAMPGFQTYDENTVWSGETDVQIFSITYDNDSGETTVRSRDGVKVLAPAPAAPTASPWKIPAMCP